MMMSDKEVGQLMNDIVGSVEIEDPKFAFNLIKETIKKAHKQGKQEGCEEERKKQNARLERTEKVIIVKKMEGEPHGPHDICEICEKEAREKVIKKIWEAVQKESLTCGCHRDDAQYKINQRRRLVTKREQKKQFVDRCGNVWKINIKKLYKILKLAETEGDKKDGN